MISMRALPISADYSPSSRAEAHSTMTKLDIPMSFKRLGGRAGLVYVSSALSKIPYGGFSPIRLQTGSASRHLRRTGTTRRLISGQWKRFDPCSPCGQCSGVAFGSFRSRGPWLVSGLCCPAESSLTMASSEALGPSRRFMRYPAGLCPHGPGSRDSPIYSACPSLRAVSRTPSDRMGLGCGSSTRAAFAVSVQARHPKCHASRFTHGSVTRLQNSLYAAARRVARPSSTRAFTFELSFHESPQRNVEYDYAGHQPTSRGRTFAGWTRSITGCEQRARRSRK
jgi:hypothetical protein